jgi:hypothetical protein
MGDETLEFSVVFQDSRVVVKCDCAKTLKECQRVFTHMQGAEGATQELASTFRVTKNHSLFRLTDKHDKLIVNGKSVQELQQFLKSEVTLDLIRANPRFIWLHASGAVLGGEAVLLTGVSGRGKSTLVSSLSQRGWKYLSDDMLPLDPDSGCILPFPAAAIRRITGESGEFLPPDRFDQLKRTFVDMKSESIFVGSAPVAGILIPEYRLDGTHQLQPSKGFSAAAELLSGCINFIEHDRNAILYLCGLIESIPVHHLTWNDPSLAAQAIIEAHG